MAYIDGGLPATIRDGEPEPLRRARMLLFMRTILFAVSAVVLCVRLASGFPATLLVQPMVSACVFALVPFVLRRSGSVNVAGHLFVGYVTLMIAATNLVTGGRLTGVHFGAVVLPLIAVLLVGAKGGAWWTLICLAQTILGFQLQRLGYEPLTLVPPEKIVLGAMLGPIVVTVVVFGVAAWFEWTKSSALTGLIAARDEADRANAAKSQFLSHMSHELRTPMNGVVGALQILRASPLTEDQGKYLDIGRDSARHMIALLNDILDVSKLEAGALTLERIDLDLSDLAAKVLDLSRPAITAKGVEIRYREELTAGRVIVGDPLRIRQVITNILNNASKFTARGHVELMLSTRHLNGEL